MHLSYEKLGLDHPMYGKAEYVVMDELQPVCYKTKAGYLPIEPNITSSSSEQAHFSVAVKSQPLYILSFKVNDEVEEMVFKSKKKFDKTMALFGTKEFITDLETKVYQTVD